MMAGGARAPSAERRRNLIIPQLQPFCQAKSVKKLHKHFPDSLCILPIVIILGMQYSILVKRNRYPPPTNQWLLSIGSSVSATYRPVVLPPIGLGIRRLQTNGTLQDFINLYGRKEQTMANINSANHVITVYSISDLPACRYMGMKNGWEYWRAIKTNIIYRIWG